MSISMTIRSGTARNFPQKGDSGLFGEVTSWANDVTSAVNKSPTKNQTAPYDAIVGTAANVTAGVATHSDIATAIAAVSANDRIFILENTYEPSAQIDVSKALTIIGQGEGAVIEGDNIASGSVFKISSSGVTLDNFKIIQGSGTPDYALEIAAATERCNLNIKADGTFAINLFLNSSDIGAITGFISYDTNSVFFGGESQMVEQVKIQDQTTAAYNLVLQSDSDGTILTADRIFTIDVNDGARNLDLSENFTIGDGYDVTITAEDAASSIVLDEQSLEIEGEGTATRLFKIINSTDSARTLTFAADVTHTGSALTINVEDAASSITLDEQSLEIEGEGTASRLFKLINSTDSARTLTFAADITHTGNALTINVEDAASSITLDEQSLEIEGEGTASRLFKIINSTDSARTLTFAADVTFTGNALTIDVEDAAASLILDEQSFEVEGEGTASQLTKIVNANNAAATLTLEGTSSVINQDVSSDAQPTFTGVTRDSGDFTVETTTSGDVILKPVSTLVIVNKAAATNATSQTIKFGDDTGGISGLRNNSGVLEYNSGGAGWIAVSTALQDFIGCCYTTDAGQSIVKLTWTTVVFEDLVFDTDTIMNTSTGVMTIPTTGKYFIFARTDYAAASWAIDTGPSMAIYIDGSVLGNIAQDTKDATRTQIVSNEGGRLLDLTAAQTVEVRTFHGETSNRSLYGASSYQNCTVSLFRVL